MRHTRRAAVAVALTLLFSTPVGGTAQELPDLPGGPGALISQNIDYLGTIPLDSPGIGGKVVKVGDQTRFYVTGAKGLSIYDVTIPFAPILIGALPLPHFQNEDVDVSDDGTRVIVSDDTTHGLAFILDTTITAVPILLGFFRQNEHTIMCADADCKWLYGRTGRIYDARDPAAIKIAGNWGGRGHALNRDASGLIVSDTNPRLVLDPRTDPANPTVLASGTPFPSDGFLQHNNVRPAAEQWVPRASGDNGGPMRPGELLIGNSESNFTGTCASFAGGLTTWDMRDFNRGQSMRPIEKLRPRSGTWLNGDPAANGLGCSGHWFTVNSDYVVAAAWYEHGARLVKVDPGTGAMNQIGFFQPVATSAGAAHWIDDEYFYVVDYSDGIHILRYDASAPVPTDAQIQASWAPVKAQPAAAAERYACRLTAAA